MLLRNLQKIDDDNIIDIRIKGNKIDEVGSSLENLHGPPEIFFENHIVFPGLINSHDHLDFDLFPKLGNRLYNNYVEWGDDIHKHNKCIIESVLKIPVRLRILCGLYKNLLSGITTVVNHGPRIDINDRLITVFQQCYVLHSVQLEKYWKYKLNNPFAKKWPLVIHIGEGKDDASFNETDKLIKSNFVNRDLVGVHGIAMNEAQAMHLKALVWCPDSNYFLIGKTAPIQKLKQFTNVVFGTDSTVSSSWNVWEHLRLARKENAVSDEELYKMLTTAPAGTWQLKGHGKLKRDYYADIVVARKKNGRYGYDAFYALNPEDILMVMHKGNIRLFDEELLEQLRNYVNVTDSFSKVFINGYFKYVYGDLDGLMTDMRHYNADISFPFL